MATLGLSMIVKNGGEGFRSCLESARSILDQIVIMDTGSTDDTLTIAKEFGATIGHFTWCDDYAKARNAALARVTTDWVLSLDADEELSPESSREIHRLVNLHTEGAAYQLSVRHYCRSPFFFGEGTSSQENGDNVEQASSAPFYYETPRIALFKRHPGVFYEGCVHEVVDHRIAALGLATGDTDARIRHYGLLLGDEAARLRKQAYYRQLGHRKLLEEPLNVGSWYLLGLAEFQEGNTTEALRCMTQAYALSRREQPLYYIAAIHHQEGRNEEALNFLSGVGDMEGLGMQKNNLMGKILHDLQRFDEARLCYRKALQECDRNPSLGSWRSSLENQLGYVEVRLGNWAAGLEMLHRSIKTTPNVLEFHNRLVKACVLAGDDVGAADAAEAILEYGQMEGLFTRAVALRMRTGQFQQAHGLIERGLGCFPDSAALRAMQFEALRLAGSHLPEPGVASTAFRDDKQSARLIS